MKKTETEHMKGIATEDNITVMTGEKGQGRPQEETGETRTKPRKITDLMKKTEKSTAPDQRAQQADYQRAQHTEMTLTGIMQGTVEDTEKTPDQEKTKTTERAQDQGKIKDLETTPEKTQDTETTLDKEKTQDQGTAQTATGKDQGRTETSEAKAETETHGKQCPSTKET